MVAKSDVWCMRLLPALCQFCTPASVMWWYLMQFKCEATKFEFILEYADLVQAENVWGNIPSIFVAGLQFSNISLSRQTTCIGQYGRVHRGQEIMSLQREFRCCMVSLLWILTVCCNYMGLVLQNRDWKTGKLTKNRRGSQNCLQQKWLHLNQ